jgi:uncharacterized protein YkwD
MKKLLVITGLLILVIAAAFGYKTFSKPKDSAKPSKIASTPAPKTTQTQEPEVQLDTAEIHGLINQERAKAKLKALTVNDDLKKIRSSDLF